MKNVAVLALIIGGALVLLAPIAAKVYSSNRAQERVAEFYARNTNMAVLPDAMHRGDIGPMDLIYFCGCWVAGVGMVFAGVRQARSTPAAIHSSH